MTTAAESYTTTRRGRQLILARRTILPRPGPGYYHYCNRPDRTVVGRERANRVVVSPTMKTNGTTNACGAETGSLVTRAKPADGADLLIGREFQQSSRKFGPAEEVKNI